VIGMDTNSEIWLPIAVSTGRYEVSSSGRVRNAKTKRILNPMVTGRRRSPRPKIRIATNPNVDICVAAAVLEAFVSQRPAGYVVMHIDDNPLNNALVNLRWGTPQDNARDMAQKTRGGFQRLAPSDVVNIRRRRTAGERGVELAVEFGVSEQRICDIYKGRTTL
jgi:hypothetical protein